MSIFLKITIAIIIPTLLLVFAGNGRSLFVLWMKGIKPTRRDLVTRSLIAVCFFIIILLWIWQK